MPKIPKLTRFSFSLFTVVWFTMRFCVSVVVGAAAAEYQLAVLIFFVVVDWYPLSRDQQSGSCGHCRDFYYKILFAPSNQETTRNIQSPWKLWHSPGKMIHCTSIDRARGDIRKVQEFQPGDFLRFGCFKYLGWLTSSTG